MLYQKTLNLFYKYYYNNIYNFNRILFLNLQIFYRLTRDENIFSKKDLDVFTTVKQFCLALGELYITIKMNLMESVYTILIIKFHRKQLNQKTLYRTNKIIVSEKIYISLQ